MIVVICSALLLFLIAIRNGYFSRTALHVLEDLSDEVTSAKSLQTKVASHLRLSNECRKGVFNHKTIPILCGFVALAAFSLTGKLSVGSAPAVFVLGLALGFLGEKIRKRKLREDRVREMEFFLPIVMERVVMAVQAGLDIIAALKSLIELDERNRSEETYFDQERADPVSNLLARAYGLTESGLSFEQALDELAGKSECTSLRHAFIHLALAHKEGGELVMPLRELSDSTQLFYQESVEEEIAKLPVKATMPLLLTFAGLLICFITVPLIQLIGITSKAAGL